jgi:hypothetical protein
MLLATELAAGSDDEGVAGADDAGSEEAGVDEAGSEEAGVDDAGVDEAGVDEAGVDEAASDDAATDAGVELGATEELDFLPLPPLPPQAVRDAANTIINGRFLSIAKLLDNVTAGDHCHLSRRLLLVLGTA